MNILLKPLTIFFEVVAIIFLILVGQLNAQAPNEATFSISPTSGNIVQNTEVEFEIDVNSGDDQINVVSLELEYDQTKLEFVRFDGSQSDFEFPAPADPSGNGVVNIVRGTAVEGGVRDTSKVGKAVFKVTASSGTTTLRFGVNSHIIKIGAIDIWNGESSAGTFDVTASTTAQPTEEQSQSGPSTAPSENLVAIKVTDTNNQPVVNKVVKIGERTSTTDNTGIASFGGLPADTYTAQVVEENGDVVAETEFSITDDISPTVVQQFEVQVDEKQNTTQILVIVFSIVAIVLLILFIINRKKLGLSNIFNRNNNSNKFPYDNQSPNQIDKINTQIPSSGQVINPSENQNNY